MIVNKGAIGIREFIAIIFMAIGLKISDMTLSILYAKGETSAWLVIFTAAIFNILPLFLLMKLLKHYQDKNLMQIIYHLLGKYLGFMVGLVLLFIAFFANFVDSRSYSEIISTMYYRRTPLVVIHFLLIFSSYYIAKRGVQTIGRVALLIFPIIALVSFLLIVLLMGDFTLDRIFPFFGCGYFQVVKQGFLKNSIFGELIVFALIFPYVRNERSYRLGIYIGFGLSVFALVLFAIIFLGLFSYPSVENVTYPFHEAIRYVDITEALTNNEIFFFAFWLYASLVRFSIYLYLLSVLFGSIFSIHEFEPLLPSLAFLTYLVGLIPENPVYNTLILREHYLLEPTSFALFLLPLILWIVAKWKGEFKK